MRAKGKIKTWNDERGFGFIKPFGGGPDTFVHIKAFPTSDRRPEVGAVVTYTVAKDSQGRPRAEAATLAGQPGRRPHGRRANTRTIIFATLFLVTVLLSSLLTGLPFIVPVTYFFLSAITLMAYALDKSAAKAGRWRTSEATLHLFALFGGWPGALIAQATLRHKTRKTSFRAAFWMTVVINSAALVWLHTEDGRTQVDYLATLLRS